MEGMMPPFHFLFFSKPSVYIDQNSSVKTFFSRNGILILGFIFILSLIALIAVGLAQNKKLPDNFKYGIVFDAGSSHTSMYIYKWSAEKMNDTGLVYETASCEVKGPGISSYASNLQDIPVYLSKCMGKAKDLIPKYKHQDTPLYLGATAGMRLLRMENEELAKMILSAVTSLFNSYPFNFQGARIISGFEEGAYGWITINYLLGKLEKHNWKNQFLRENETQDTYGALDLGGASTQITFVTSTQISKQFKKTTQFRLYGKNYTVYTYSYLCHGVDQALLRKLALNAKDASPGALMEPCFHPGYERTVLTSSLFSSVCTKIYKNWISSRNLTIQGTGNFQKCKESITELFQNNYCNASYCTFDMIYRPPTEGHFGAFSAYYYAMDFLNLTSDKVSSLDMVTHKMEEFCSTPWSVVNTAFPQVKEKYLSEYCFSGTYVLTLLQKYNLTEYWTQVEFMDKINNKTEAGWTLGYMLNLTNMIPAELPQSKPFSHPTYISLMVIFSLLLAIVFILGSVMFQKSSYFWK
ncbi:PREDICTED: ectonucleoside triphosphate diphosphohydrolase 1 [Chrysochloris asiatica]|uniref:Ectonucleoside triphosphate diphosphohydrolase 1 n=1 Tax=Chrysochloris asiatica TaxID=185453 RepID=A0A9B0WER8_CHRAS|nr:PREDICTED: ectonucleoside triphosphate diphosphohydrolase 1 [Chrysochloris asiatica]